MGAPAAGPRANSFEDSSNGGAPVYALPDFYHSYASMKKELRDLGKSCGLSVHQAALGGVTVGLMMFVYFVYFLFVHFVCFLYHRHCKDAR